MHIIQATPNSVSRADGRRSASAEALGLAEISAKSFPQLVVKSYPALFSTTFRKGIVLCRLPTLSHCRRT